MFNNLLIAGYPNFKCFLEAFPEIFILSHKDLVVINKHCILSRDVLSGYKNLNNNNVSDNNNNNVTPEVNDENKYDHGMYVLNMI